MASDDKYSGSLSDEQESIIYHAAQVLATSEPLQCQNWLKAHRSLPFYESFLSENRPLFPYFMKIKSEIQGKALNVAVSSSNGSDQESFSCLLNKAFLPLLNNIIRDGTQKSIQMAINWVFSKAKSPETFQSLALFLLSKATEYKSEAFLPRLRILYLLHDILFHSFNNPTLNFKVPIIKPVISNIMKIIFEESGDSLTDVNQKKIEKLVYIWKQKKYFSEDFINSLLISSDKKQQPQPHHQQEQLGAKPPPKLDTDFDKTLFLPSNPPQPPLPPPTNSSPLLLPLNKSPKTFSPVNETPFSSLPLHPPPLPPQPQQPPPTVFISYYKQPVGILVDFLLNKPQIIPYKLINAKEIETNTKNFILKPFIALPQAKSVDDLALKTQITAFLNSLPECSLPDFQTSLASLDSILDKIVQPRILSPSSFLEEEDQIQSKIPSDSGKNFHYYSYSKSEPMSSANKTHSSGSGNASYHSKPWNNNYSSTRSSPRRAFRSEPHSPEAKQVQRSKYRSHSGSHSSRDDDSDSSRGRLRRKSPSYTSSYSRSRTRTSSYSSESYSRSRSFSSSSSSRSQSRSQSRSVRSYNRHRRGYARSPSRDTGKGPDYSGLSDETQSYHHSSFNRTAPPTGRPNPNLTPESRAKGLYRSHGQPYNSSEPNESPPANHHHLDEFRKRQSSHYSQFMSSRKVVSTSGCYECGQFSHTAKNCPNLLKR